jgi:FtsZ-interacting cell division protein ZipA
MDLSLGRIWPVITRNGLARINHNRRLRTMDTIPTSWIVFGTILVVALLVAAAWVLSQRKKRSLRLQQRFGPEYSRTVDEFGGRAKAESELKAREKRLEHLSITTLAPSEAARFSQAWNALQSRFVDNPKGVVAQADQLVRELMLARGYPMGDFERRSADISVDHPAVVETYRAAQAIAVRDQRGEANTEELRKAVVHFRALFDELLEVRETKQEASSIAA